MDNSIFNLQGYEVSMEELDALVAEKVMGWERLETEAYEARFPHKARRGVIGFDGQLHRNNGPWFYPPGWVILGSAHENGCALPEYSADISAAFQIVKKLRKDGLNFMICAVPQGYSCAFTRDNNFTGEMPYIDSAPHAICLAALKAVGHGTEK